MWGVEAERVKRGAGGVGWCASRRLIVSESSRPRRRVKQMGDSGTRGGPSHPQPKPPTPRCQVTQRLCGSHFSSSSHKARRQLLSAQPSVPPLALPLPCPSSQGNFSEMLSELSSPSAEKKPLIGECRGGVGGVADCNLNVMTMRYQWR